MSWLRDSIESVRYEAGRWPLWRLDQNARYVAKSLLHRPHPHTPADAAHHRAAHAYLAAATWRAPREQARAVARVAAVGDLMWLRSGYDTFLGDAVRAHLAGADVTLANLETPVDPHRPVRRYVYETLRYNAPPAYLGAWPEAPAHRVFSLCNNHALDQGLGGLRATRAQVLARTGAVALGGPDELDQAVARIEPRPGLAMSLGALTFGVNPGPSGEAVPAGVPVVRFGDPSAPDRAGHERVLAQLLGALRSHPAAWRVLVAHWGYEYEWWPEAALRADACALIEAGVDLVVGSSPHVLQPVEIVSVNGWDPACPVQVRRPDGEARPAVIAWSLGNFASIMPTRVCQTAAVLTLELGLDAAARPALFSLTAHPTVCRRGLGARWLDARVLDVTTLARRHPDEATAARAHARHILGPIVAEAPGDSS